MPKTLTRKDLQRYDYVFLGAIVFVLLRWSLFFAFQQRAFDVHRHMALIFGVSGMIGLGIGLFTNATFFRHHGITMLGVVLVSYAFFAAGSLVERKLWYSSPDRFSRLSALRNQSDFVVDDFRYFKLRCQSKDIGSPLHVIDVDDRTYVRCGKQFPRSYTMSANTNQYVLAVNDVATIAEGSPIRITGNALTR